MVRRLLRLLEATVTFPRTAPPIRVMVMHRASRLTAALSGLLLSAMVVVTSGFACSNDAGGVTMASMHMSGAATEAGQNVIASHSTAEHPEHGQAPCKFPWAPDGCQSMVPCSPSVIATPLMQLTSFSALPQSVVALVALQPHSEIPAPELPPPRA